MSTKSEAKISVEDTEYRDVSADGSYSDYKDNSRSKFRKALSFMELQEKGNLSTSQLFLFNPDLQPVEEKRRRWSWFNFVFFWIADSFNVNTFQILATGVQLGLTWWQTWITVWIGYSLTGIFVVLAARVGTYYHISFPVSCRTSFGVFGSLWPVLNRVVMAIVWYAVQSWIGGQCVQAMLKAIFGNDLNTRIPDHIGSSAATTFEFLGFFLFWLFSLPAIWFPPHQIRHLFTVKAYVVPFAAIGFLVWVLVKADGVGSVIHESSALHGSAFGWAFVNSVMNSLANFATLIVNAPDFSRFAKTEKSALWSQLFLIPICFSLTSLVGILVSSASSLLTEDGSVLWSPLDIFDLLLAHNSSGSRAGVFFIAFGFAIAQLGTNISANSLSAGTDMTALLPRYINIRRGGYICALLALCICPWELMSSSNRFTTYLSAYAVFLSAIAGTIASDYFFIRRGYIKLFDLYSADSHCVYTYTKGVNWRAYVAYICGILPNIVGFVGATGTHIVPMGATYLYYLNFFAGYICSFVVYALLCMISPIPGRPIDQFFVKGWYEQWSEVEDFADVHRGGLVEAGQHSQKQD